MNYIEFYWRQIKVETNLDNQLKNLRNQGTSAYFAYLLNFEFQLETCESGEFRCDRGIGSDRRLKGF